MFNGSKELHTCSNIFVKSMYLFPLPGDKKIRKHPEPLDTFFD